MDVESIRRFVDRTWDESITPTLVKYIEIPNQSPEFDPQWAEHGHMDRAADLLEAWARAQALPGLVVERHRLEGRTPLLYLEVPGTGDDTVVLYGHFDKQPPMSGWEPELGPWKPVIRGDKLYGRGGADDGYSLFASLTAIRALADQGIPHARCVVLIEGCEESGSYDLPYYIDALADRIGQPSLVICLDSGCATYDEMWTTTSLRGMAAGTLRVDILTEGVHSGEATGAVPSSFRILRQLLSRVEDPETGEILLPELHAEIPEQRRAQAAKMGSVLGDEVWDHYPFVDGARPITRDATEVLLNRTWRPTLAVTGVDGMPPLATAGNVLRPHTAVKLSFRLPPTVSSAKALAAIEKALVADPPYGARVRFTDKGGADGWNAPALAPWLESSANAASEAFFGRPAQWMGEGGTIPFMGMLGEKFPEAQFLITGVLGPKSNAHGPNEFLHLPTGKRLTACVATILAAHLKRPR